MRLEYRARTPPNEKRNGLQQEGKRISMAFYNRIQLSRSYS